MKVVQQESPNIFLKLYHYRKMIGDVLEFFLPLTCSVRSSSFSLAKSPEGGLPLPMI